MKKVLSIVFNDMRHDSRVMKEATTLGEAGFAVTVAALEGDDLPATEDKESYSIQRVPLWSRRFKHIMILRPLIYLEFLARTLLRFPNPDFLHIHSIEPLPLGVMLKARSAGRASLIYDAHEYESEKNGLRGWMKWSIKTLEWMCMPFVDGFITVSERILKDYRDKYKVARYTLVHNCPPPRPSKRTTSLRQELGLQQDDILFIYQGGLTYGRGLEVLIKAFSQPTPGRHLIVMGYGVLADMVEQAADQSQYLHYKSAVPPEVLLEYTASADVGIALIEPICLSYEYCLPNKLFEYAMAGLPVIVSPLPEMKEKVERYSIGKVLPDHSAESLRKVVEEWSSDSYESFVDNLKEFSEKYNWDVESARMLALYRSIST